MTTHSAESQATFFSFLLKVLDKILAPVKSSQNKNCRGPEMGPGFSHEQKKKNPVLPTQNASALCTLSKHPDLLYRFFFFNIGGRKSLLINLKVNVLFVCVYSHDGSVSCIFVLL